MMAGKEDGEAVAGGCACGAVRFAAQGTPKRVGLCHCLTCRKRHGAPFNCFVTYAAEAVALYGELTAWPSSEHGERRGCARCGAPICWADDAGSEIELHAGSFDAPGLFEPEYEIWVSRREPWLWPLDVPQFEEDRLVN